MTPMLAIGFLSAFALVFFQSNEKTPPVQRRGLLIVTFLIHGHLLHEAHMLVIGFLSAFALIFFQDEVQENEKSRCIHHVDQHIVQKVRKKTVHESKKKNQLSSVLSCKVHGYYDDLLSNRTENIRDVCYSLHTPCVFSACAVSRTFAHLVQLYHIFSIKTIL